MRRRSVIALGLCIFILLAFGIGGCSQSNRGFLSDDTPDLPSLSRFISDSGMQEALKKQGYKWLASSSTDDAVELTVRRIGDHRTPFTQAEIESIKQTAYGFIGYKFPLEVTGSVLSATPQMVGRVTAVDGNRILVVDTQKTVGDTDNPEAMWYTFDPSTDSAIRMNKTGSGLTIGHVKVGYAVEAWGEWIVMQSYPSQTDGLELNILSTDAGEPKLRGTIEEIHLSDNGSDPSESYLIVNGNRVNLASFTQYIEEDHIITADMLRKGDQVEIWDIGYPNISNSIAATRIERIS